MSTETYSPPAVSRPGSLDPAPHLVLPHGRGSYETIDDASRQGIVRAIRDAEAISGYTFSVYIGASDGNARGFATHLHSALTAPDKSVLIMVDPSARIVEVVTGKDARRTLTNHEAGLAVLAMQSDFAVAGLASGIVRGLHQLAEQGRM